MHAMGLLLLIPGILLPAALVSYGQLPPQNVLKLYTTLDTAFQDSSPKNPGEPDNLKLLKIRMILKNFNTGLPPQKELQLANLIYRESLQYHYEPELILALILTESSFYNWSKSRVGAIGLMQILPTTGQAVARAQNIPWRGKKTLFNPHLNIKLGTHYLSLLHIRFGDLELALTAYNYGPSRIAEMQKHCHRLPQAYASRIMHTYKKFLELDYSDLRRVMAS